MDESRENLSNKAGIYFELRAYKKKCLYIGEWGSLSLVEEGQKECH